MDQKNELDLKTISPHFTEEILHKAVNEYFKKKTGKTPSEILDYTVKIGSGKGDGYMGVLYKIQVILKPDIKINLIGKGMPSNIARRKTFHCDLFFANEVFFYNNVVPAFHEFERQQLGTKFAHSLLELPDCYYAMSDGINDFLVLEDLREDGYDNADRALVLGTDRITEMFLLFARFHAFSLALKYIHSKKFQMIIDQSTETLFHRVNGLWTDRYLATLAKYYKSAVKSELENTMYMDRFERFTTPEIFFPKIYHTVETRDSKSVINHGDTWVTNFMFKDSAVKAIDFQLVRYGSPVLDLSTLIFACTDLEQRNKLGGIEGILVLYQRELNQVVKSLGAPDDAGMSMEELLSAWRQFGALGFGFSIELIQLSLIEEEDVEDLDRFDGDQALTLADITPFAEVKSIEGKKRLAEALRCAVDSEVI